MLHRITTASRRRPRAVLAAWIVATALGFFAAPVLFGGLTSQAGSIDGSEAARAQLLLDRSSPNGEQIYAVADGRAADDPA
ncbi:MAG: hypothetical protein M3140_12245, partial [Actinomycetota bacterium]|nr:hypothetical protein [Actinomycetota bacterium]